MKKNIKQIFATYKIEKSFKGDEKRKVYEINLRKMWYKKCQMT